MQRDWLKNARGAKTCEEIAGAVGISVPYYFLIEQGQRRARGLTVAQAAELGKACGIDPMEAVKEEIEWLKKSWPL